MRMVLFFLTALVGCATPQSTDQQPEPVEGDRIFVTVDISAQVRSRAASGTYIVYGRYGGRGAFRLGEVQEDEAKTFEMRWRNDWLRIGYRVKVGGSRIMTQVQNPTNITERMVWSNEIPVQPSDTLAFRPVQGGLSLRVVSR